jgi:endonuclease/exonuclease/phosphatase (EEP) superfamily protein YafD
MRWQTDVVKLHNAIRAKLQTVSYVNDSRTSRWAIDYLFIMGVTSDEAVQNTNYTNQPSDSTYMFLCVQ